MAPKERCNLTVDEKTIDLFRLLPAHDSSIQMFSESMPHLKKLTIDTS